MAATQDIPVFTLFGETVQLPDLVHAEPIADRAPVHNWRIAAHRHSQVAQLLYLARGQASARVDARDIALTTGSFLYLPTNVVHAFDFAPGAQGTVLTMPMSVLKSVGPAPDRVQEALSRPFAAQAGDRLPGLIAVLLDTLAHAGSFRASAAVGLAHAILATLAEIAAMHVPDPAPPADPRLARLDALIADHQHQGWQVADYASALSISTGHLSRLCRHATGRGAKAYIDQAKMEEACRLLAFTRIPVAEVGYRLGFDDPSYFSKCFSKAQGLAPSLYRRNVAQPSDRV